MDDRFKATHNVKVREIYASSGASSTAAMELKTIMKSDMTPDELNSSKFKQTGRVGNVAQLFLQGEICPGDDASSARRTPIKLRKTMSTDTAL